MFTIGAEGQQQDLLVNTIGGYVGTVLFDVTSGEHSVAFEIAADGAWSAVIKPVLQARPWDPATPLTGRGDDVVLVTPAVQGFAPVTLSHAGTANFAIFAYSATGADLLVNEIGNYSGEVLLGRGTLLLEITADGDWSVTPQ